MSILIGIRFSAILARLARLARLDLKKHHLFVRKGLFKRLLGSLQTGYFSIVTLYRDSDRILTDCNSGEGLPHLSASNRLFLFLKYRCVYSLP